MKKPRETHLLVQVTHFVPISVKLSILILRNYEAKKEHDLKPRNNSILIPIVIDSTRDFCCVEQVSNTKLAFQGRKTGKLLNHPRYLHAMQYLNIY